MIQEVQDLKFTTEFVYHYIIEELHEKQVEKDDVYEMLAYAKEDKNSYVYESYLNGEVNGVFIGGIQENTISLDDFFCNKSEIFYDLFNFFKNRFQGYTLVSYFYKKDEILKNVLENHSASIEMSSYLMSYNSFLSNIKKIKEDILLIKYDKKYFKILKKLNAKTDLDLEMVYIVLKKKKPLGFVEVSLLNENDVYIED
ncbi:MAG: hypothetical protein K2I42_04855, partial [Anaeroplasmataceae bacterium]|nr:hypothetical protein [Anaeroplasmataceae bacterium]